MTFYEQELRKIVGERYPDATYVGRACYVRLSDMNRAKIQFVAGIVANQYNALQLTILNRGEGQVDALRLRFSDLLGTKMTSNPNFRNGVEPHIWDDYGKVSWYVYHPTRQDYAGIAHFGHELFAAVHVGRHLQTCHARVLPPLVYHKLGYYAHCLAAIGKTSVGTSPHQSCAARTIHRCVAAQGNKAAQFVGRLYIRLRHLAA